MRGNKQINSTTTKIMLWHAAFLIMIASVFAVPQNMNIHGRLTNTAGIALEGAYSIRFRIYDSYTGGATLFDQTSSVTTDEDGVYSAILYGVNLNFTAQNYLGIKVAADAEMTPRINLTTTPYSYRANVSSGLECTNCVSGSELIDNTIEEVDLESTNEASDNYLLSYDSASGGFTWVADTDTQNSTDYYATGGQVTGTATKTLNLERLGIANVSFSWTDYDTDTDTTCSATDSCGNILYETELDSLAELNSQIADATIVPSGGTLTSGKWCVYDGTGIDCNVEPVSDTANNTDYFVTAGGVTGTTTKYLNLIRDGISNVSISWTDLDTDTNTQLTQEQVEDFAGGMDAGTETRVSFTYNDGTGNFDIVVDDMNDDTPDSDAEVPDAITVSGGTIALGSNTYSGNLGIGNLTEDVLTEAELDSLSELNTQISDATLVPSGGTLTSGKWCVYDGTGIDCNVEPVSDTANNTDYFVTAGGVTGTTTKYLNLIRDGISNVSISWTDLDTDTDTTCSATDSCGNILYETELDSLAELNSQIADATLLKSGGTLTTSKWCVYDGSGIDCNVEPVSDTDTTLSEENVEDYIGAGVSGNTETRITVTYQDADGTFDFVVDDMNDDTPDSDAEVPDAITVSGGTIALGSNTYSGNLGIGNLTDDVLTEAELDSLSELNTQIADATLLKSGGTLTSAKWCVYDGSGIDCNVEPVSDTNTNANTECAAGQFLEGDGSCTDVLEETELDSLAELNSQIADATLLKSGGTLTTSKWCVYDGSGIDCNVNPVSDTDTTCDSTSCAVTNTGTLDGFEGNQLVAVAGDTMTGALTINDNDGVDGETMLTIGDSNDLDNLLVYGNVTFGGGGYIYDNGTTLILGHT